MSKKLLIPIAAIATILWAQQPAVSITLKNNTKREAETRAQLEGLLKRFNLAKWTFTTKTEIDERAIPHSHPVLTLNAGNQDELHLLSEYIHEQLHWLEEARAEGREKAIADLQRLYPDLPSRPPEGARDRYSSYLHLIVCLLEFDGLKELVGEDKAKAVFEHWAQHHYKAIYRKVLDDQEKLRTVVIKHGLAP